MLLVWTLTRWGARSTTGWRRTAEWRVLNTGAPTRAGYGEGSRLTAPDVALAHRDLARRCTWKLGEDLGSDHLPQVVTATLDGCLPRRIRKTKWAFKKANWPAFAADCDDKVKQIPIQDLSVDELSTQLIEAILNASHRWIPRGAQANPKPWAEDPDLVDAVGARREAREELQLTHSEEARERWKEAKQRATEVEAAARQRRFRVRLDRT